MIHLLSFLACLSHLVQGTTASGGSTCPSPASNEGTRSVWSILAGCGLTLLICVWYTLHPDVPKPGQKFHIAILKRVGFALLSFFSPEVVVGRASEEWCEAHGHVRKFREQGYEWSMTHSHFAIMHGFIYRNDKGRSRPIYPDEFLEHCKAGNIANPLITEEQIKDKSKSDVLGKVILVVQLFWFMLQVIIRGSFGLAVTLIELDTVCMAVLALVYVCFWWDKPLRPDYPHTFYFAEEKKEYTPTQLSKAWKRGPGYLHASITYIRNLLSMPSEEKPFPLNLSRPGKLTTMIERLNADNVERRSIFISWFILGALHLIAWNFEYPTEVEKILWRVAALVLAGSPLTLFVLLTILEAVGSGRYARYARIVEDYSILCVWVLGTISRALLVALMLASLRALPCSAHLVISWTSYIPHL